MTLVHEGILNVANSCYLNATLQCLAAIPKLTSYTHFDDLREDCMIRLFLSPYYLFTM